MRNEVLLNVFDSDQKTVFSKTYYNKVTPGGRYLLAKAFAEQKKIYWHSYIIENEVEKFKSLTEENSDLTIKIQNQIQVNFQAIKFRGMEKQEKPEYHDGSSIGTTLKTKIQNSEQAKITVVAATIMIFLEKENATTKTEDSNKINNDSYLQYPYNVIDTDTIPIKPGNEIVLTWKLNF